MRLIMKMTLAVLTCFAVGAYAGIIDFSDDDRWQVIPINCSGFDSVSVGVAVNQDTVFAETIYAPIDSIFPDQAWQYIAPDRDENNRLIPGHYEGFYLYYVDSWLNDERIASLDTFRVSVSYDISGGCNAPPVIDP